MRFHVWKTKLQSEGGSDNQDGVEMDPERLMCRYLVHDPKP